MAACGQPTYQAVALRTGSLLKPLCFSKPGAAAGKAAGRRESQSAARFSLERRRGARGCADAEAGLPLAEASGAICVQRFDGSRNSAIHTTYRISLRSSSIREPRYPLLRVVFGLVGPAARAPHTLNSFSVGFMVGVCWGEIRPAGAGVKEEARPASSPDEGGTRRPPASTGGAPTGSTQELPVWIRSIQ